MCYKVFCHILEHETRFWEHDGFSSLTPRTHTKSQTIDWTTIRCERVNKSPLNNWILPFSVSKTEKYIFSPSYRHSPPNRFCASLRVMFADWVIKTNAQSVHQMLFPAAASREYSFRTKLDLSLFWLKRFCFFFPSNEKVEFWPINQILDLPWRRCVSACTENNKKTTLSDSVNPSSFLYTFRIHYDQMKLLGFSPFTTFYSL